ncbi:hypothetical protein OUZ56_007792 [Daphnia magna]|uniref:Uncharacterized protein n=1 Tax=Daphnia magna TaxID=35525 RepID=A0ABR0AB18_9CRUS|nr:hypothetical protein OUZ56_007792 [Daphnia magna]
MEMQNESKETGPRRWQCHDAFPVVINNTSRMRNDDTQLPPIDPDRQENEEQRNSVWAVVDEVCILEWENFVGKVDRTAKSVPFWPIFVDGQQQDFQPVVVLASTTQHV